MTNTKPATRLIGGKRRRRRWIAEVLTADERLLRREYYTTASAGSAARTFRDFWRYFAPSLPAADRVEIYATPDGREPDGAPIITMLL